MKAASNTLIGFGFAGLLFGAAALLAGGLQEPAVTGFAVAAAFTCAGLALRSPLARTRVTGRGGEGLPAAPPHGRGPARGDLTVEEVFGG